MSEIVQEFLEGIDCVDVCEALGLDVKEKGNQNAICCPFHNDRHPSCYVDKKRFHCFSCNKSGDAITLVCKVKDCSFLDAVEFIEHLSGKKFNNDELVHLPTITLKEEDLEAIGIVEKQMLKTLYSENPKYFWCFLISQAKKTESMYQDFEKLLPKNEKMSKAISERLNSVGRILKTATYNKRKTPNNTIIKIIKKAGDE